MKLLLIMPNFFDYPQVISKELEKLGYEVDYFDDRPSTKGIIKAIIRINKNLISKYIEKYFQNMMKTVNKKKYDVFFLISGQSLSFSEDMIEKLRNSQKQAKFVLYQWDSEKNFPYIERMQKYFDSCYSFDRSDVEKNSKLKFLPLFYSDRYEEIGKQNKKEYNYDFCFVGTAHPKKYKFIKDITSQLKEVFPSQYIYLFFPSKLVFFYRKIRNKEFKKAQYKEFNFVPLNGEKMHEIFCQSRCVLDSAQDGQIGLTIRVIESLGAKKKLITTNADVVNYDFYRKENIYVYDDSVDLNDIFFNSAYIDLKQEVYEKYSLRNWLLIMLRNDR